MSLSWTYLTKSFVGMRYRDSIAAAMVTMFLYSKMIQHYSQEADREAIMTRLYTDDESDIEFREKYNKTDAAVRRKKIIQFAQKIKEERAKKERELMLDAFNYLNKKDHKADI